MVTPSKAVKNKLLLYNKKNRKILILNGIVKSDETIAVVWLKPHIKLYGAVKMTSISKDGSSKEYKIIGIDKPKHAVVESRQLRSYLIYLSKI